MKIPDLLSNIRLNYEASNNRSLENLRPGQLLQALVLSQTDQGTAKILLGSLEVTAKTAIRLDPGQKLLLEVTKTGTPPEMRVLQAPNLETLKTEALRSILPKQLPTAKLIENLRSQLPNFSGPSYPQAAPERIQMPDLPGNRGTPMPDLISILRSISVQSVARDEPVTAERLRRLLNESGLFLESRLAGGLAPLPNDLKGNLLRLLYLLRPRLTSKHPENNNPLKSDQVLRLGKNELPVGSPLKPLVELLTQTEDAISRVRLYPRISLPVDAERHQARSSGQNELPPGSPLKPLIELLAQTEGAIARVRMNQLISLPLDDETRQVWQFEIPINQQNHTDSFLVRLEQKKSGSGVSHDHSWAVTIDFDLQPLGPVNARINLQQGEVSSLFTAEKKLTVTRLEQALPKLHQALIKSGLKVGNLSARSGIIEKSDFGIPVPYPLLDEKA